ncbi:MAG: cobyrinate a,c-diamide synthase, partial [Okeania sp. SIO3C4]|nr:cobyrinate a,c-diamide synthase [Okeania sp. SIO3C4]
MSLIVAGERSGVGKTTVTLALLSYLKWQNLQVQSFKVGPDYIDPMFHQYVTGKSCRNLDPVLTSEVYVQQCFARNIQDVDFALVEGVMGLFDGVSFASPCPALERFYPPCPPLERGVEDEYDSILLKRGVEDEGYGYFPDFASTAHISRLLNVPVLLVLDCSRLSTSVAAIAHGLISFDPHINFAGLILNRVGSDRHLQLLQNSLKFINLPVLGVLRRHQNITIPDRHLGLLPTDEMPDLDNLINDLTDLAKTCFDWEKLLPLLKIQNKESQNFLSRQIIPNNKRHFSQSNVKNVEKKKSKFLIGVARDRAFNFYYQDNLDILEELGAKIVFWSPLKDEHLPAGVEGLYFGGGFPEVFAQQLSENILIR